MDLRSSVSCRKFPPKLDFREEIQDIIKGHPRDEGTQTKEKESEKEKKALYFLSRKCKAFDLLSMDNTTM